MIPLEKRQALLEAGFSLAELQQILDAMAKDAEASGRERKEKAPAVVGGSHFLAGVVNRLVTGESFKRVSE